MLSLATEEGGRLKCLDGQQRFVDGQGEVAFSQSGFRYFNVWRSDGLNRTHIYLPGGANPMKGRRVTLTHTQ